MQAAAETEIRAKLRGWIRKHSKSPLAGGFDDSTPLIEQRILSSLDIVEFVLFIESLRGDEIDVESIETDAFGSVDAIYRSFFTPRA
jgi:acyl carrier protein